MREQIEVIYENGVLRPVGVLRMPWQEHQRLTVSIESIHDNRSWLADADPTASLEAVRRALAKSPMTVATLVRAERDED